MKRPFGSEWNIPVDESVSSDPSPQRVAIVSCAAGIEAVLRRRFGPEHAFDMIGLQETLILRDGDMLPGKSPDKDKNV